MTRRPLLVLASVVLTLVGAGSAPASPAPAPTAALHHLFESAWEQDLVDNPLTATFYGDRRFNDRWPDLTHASLDRSHGHDLAVLAQLRRIPRAVLPPAEQLNYDLFKREYDDRVAEWPFHTEAYDISASRGVQTLSEVAEVAPFETVAQSVGGIQRQPGQPLQQQIDLSSVVPELKGRRVRARLEGNRVVPYFSRAEIAQQVPPALV